MKKKKSKPKKPKSLLEKILIIATILGGIAALGYFADKFFHPTASENDVKTIQKKVDEIAKYLEYLDGLPKTKSPNLKKLFEKGYSLYEAKKYFDAIDTLKVCLELTTTESEREALLILIGSAFHTLGNLQEAEDYYQEALQIGEAINDKEGKAAALNNIGLIYEDRGEGKKSFVYFMKANKIFKEIYMQKWIVIVERNMRRILTEYPDADIPEPTIY